jgi:2,3-dimethylmalate lyase
MSVRKKLRAIMSGKRLVLMPGAYDGLSARIIEAEGFEAICAGGNAGIGSMLAQPDTGQSNMRDYADHYARICDAVNVPVYVDADTGFGGVNNVRQMIRAFEAAGAAGVFISDQVFPNRCGYLPGKQIIPIEQALAKLKAALDARTDPDFFICGRTDAMGAEGMGVEGLNAAIERSQLFMEAGVDMAKPIGVDTVADIKRVIREVPGPHMATLSQAAGRKERSLEDLAAAGVVAATFPSLPIFAAANAVRNVLRILKRENSMTPTFDQLLTLDEYYDLVGLKEQLAKEESYDKAAAALVQKRAAE